MPSLVSTVFAGHFLLAFTRSRPCPSQLHNHVWRLGQTSYVLVSIFPMDACLAAGAEWRQCKRGRCASDTSSLPIMVNTNQQLHQCLPQTDMNLMQRSENVRGGSLLLFPIALDAMPSTCTQLTVTGASPPPRHPQHQCTKVH